MGAVSPITVKVQPVPYLMPLTSAQRCVGNILAETKDGSAERHERFRHLLSNLSHFKPDAKEFITEAVRDHAPRIMS